MVPFNEGKEQLLWRETQTAQQDHSSLGHQKPLEIVGGFMGWLSLKYYLLLALGKPFPSSHLLTIKGVYHLCLQPLSSVTLIRSY